MTTSFTHMGHGHLFDAFRVHPFGPVLFVLWGLSALACLYGFATKQYFNTDGPIWARIMAGLAIAFFAFGFVRMAVTKANVEIEPSVWSSRSVAN